MRTKTKETTANAETGRSSALQLGSDNSQGVPREASFVTIAAGSCRYQYIGTPSCVHKFGHL
jgi:hypothetical protein